jgi:exopolysaccharide production protein ExoZ
VQKLRSLQILRAVAVLGVCVFHASISRFSVGAAGVDLFFVISGFIISKVAARRARPAFIADRLWRIFPLYLLCAAAFWLLVPPHRTICADVASLTLLPISCRPYLDPAWTLVYEIGFYGLVAVFMANWKGLIAALLSLVVVGQFVPIGQLGTPLVLEFAAGVLIARMPLRAGLAAPLLVAGALALFLTPDMTFQHLRFAEWGAPAAAIVYSGLAIEEKFAGRGWDFAVELGNASYSIYLVHFLVHVVFSGRFALDLVAMVSAGYIVHRVVERPLLALPRLLNLHIHFHVIDRDVDGAVRPLADDAIFPVRVRGTVVPAERW